MQVDNYTPATFSAHTKAHKVKYSNSSTQTKSQSRNCSNTLETPQEHLSFFKATVQMFLSKSRKTAKMAYDIKRNESIIISGR